MLIVGQDGGFLAHNDPFAALKGGVFGGWQLTGG
jgi:hypothetical protein